MASILIVEDDRALQEAYSFILKTAEYDIAQAYNGEEGLNKAHTRAYDLILLDIHMPIMDGLQFLSHYDAPHQSGKVIVFSNMVEPGIIKQAQALGAFRCVLKSSMTPSAMLALVKETLDSKA